MTSTARLPYQRLANQGFNPYHNDNLECYHSITGSRTWWKFRRIPLRRRFRLRVTVPGPHRFLRRRASFVASYRKVLKRLKESQSHFGDLFAGNYLFMQVNPTPLKAVLQKPYEIHQAFSNFRSIKLCLN